MDYVLAGVSPIASAGELADIVRTKVPGAQISFKPDAQMQSLLDRVIRPLDDTNAQTEWNWKLAYNQEKIVDDFLQELERNPQRYT
jgi:hypothetical protein